MNKNQLDLLDALTIYRQHTGEENIKVFLADHAQFRNTDQLNLSDLDLITLINQYPDTRIKELIPYTHMTQSAVSKILMRLVKFGYVNKQHHADDRKDVYLSLTDSGKQLADVHSQYHQQQTEQLTAILSAYSNAEIDQFTQLLTQINRLRENNASTF